MFVGTALSVRLLNYAGLSLFIINGPYVYMVVCIVYLYNLTEVQSDNKEHNVDTSDGPDSQLEVIVITPEKCDVITEQVQVEEDKRDVSESEKRAVIKDKRDVMTHAHAEENESCSSRAEKKTGSSDSYDSEMEDTTDESSSQEVQQTTTDKHDEKHDVKTKEVYDVGDEKCDVKTEEVHDVGDEKLDVEERPESPDHSVVQVSRKACKIVDKVPPTREEKRSQYSCNLARKFVKTDYKYKSPNVGPELDIFEDEDLSEYNSDTTNQSARASATSTTSDSCVRDSDNSNSEESVMYVTISFHSHYLSPIRFIRLIT